MDNMWFARSDFPLFMVGVREDSDVRLDHSFLLPFPPSLPLFLSLSLFLFFCFLFCFLLFFDAVPAPLRFYMIARYLTLLLK